MSNIVDNEIINVSNTHYDSESNPSSISILSSISSDDEIVVIKKKIIINYTNQIDNNNNYLNNKKNECLICFDKLKKNKILIQNNYCKCFFFSLLCEKCFLRWFIDNNKCFICRNSFCPDKNDIFKLFEFYNAILLFKLTNIINNRKGNNKFNVTLPHRQQTNPQSPLTRIPQPITIHRNNTNQQTYSQSSQNVLRIPIHSLSNSNNSNQRNRRYLIDTPSVEISNEIAVEAFNDTENNSIILSLLDCKSKITDMLICFFILTFGGCMFYIIYIAI